MIPNLPADISTPQPVLGIASIFAPLLALLTLFRGCTCVRTARPWRALIYALLSLILFDRGDEIVVQAGERGVRFLFVSGKPIEEPVAWRGPIVMNTQEELRDAFRELREGTFIRP